jgi:hypothetical protein
VSIGDDVGAGAAVVASASTLFTGAGAAVVIGSLDKGAGAAEVAVLVAVVFVSTQ